MLAVNVRRKEDTAAAFTFVRLVLLSCLLKFAVSFAEQLNEIVSIYYVLYMVGPLYHSINKLITAYALSIWKVHSH